MAESQGYQADFEQLAAIARAIAEDLENCSELNTLDSASRIRFARFAAASESLSELSDGIRVIWNRVEAADCRLPGWGPEESPNK